MKKVMMGMLTLALTVFLFQAGTQASETIDDITIYVDNELVVLDTQAVIRNNRTLVPLRGVFEKLGATVDWNQETKQVIVQDEDMEILLKIENDAVLVDGQIEFLDTKSMVIDDRTLVPIRFIAETLGYEVTWEQSTHRIDINSQETVVETMKDLPTVDSLEAMLELLEYNYDLDTYVTNRFFSEEIMIDVDEATDGMVEPTMPDSAMEETAVESESKESNDFSDTNDQVEGVSEGDIIKTDGDNVYYTKDNEVYIISADPSNPEVLSTIKVDDSRGYIQELYVQDEKLTIIGTSYATYAYPVDILEESQSSLLVKESPYYYTSNTFTFVYDISDPLAPVKEFDMDYEGNYVSSRSIGDDLYIVTNKAVNYYELDYIYSDADITNVTEKEEYALKPKYANNMTGEVVTIGFDEIYYFPNNVQPNFITTVGIDLSTYTTKVQSYLGSAENIYASMDNLYLTFTNYEYTNEGEGLIYVPNYKINTAIYKFALDNGTILFNKEGEVEGSVLNQFSLDQHEGNLRIATTKGEMWNPDNPSKNNVYILDEMLQPIGELTGLAEGERIYSTRFAGDRIYMVTFRQVDPFFVIDASDPSAPKVLGELKIPGFSTYLHILDENHVIGFGKDTVDNGTFVTEGGFKIALFDVTDPTNPIEKKTEVIGMAGTYSELEYNHKALMISLSKGIMGFPISISSKTPYSQDFAGAYIYDITNESFDFRGSITHKDGEDSYNYYQGDIRRVIYIGDYIYSLSNTQMKVTEIESMEEVGNVEY